MDTDTIDQIVVDTIDQSDVVVGQSICGALIRHFDPNDNYVITVPSASCQFWKQIQTAYNIALAPNVTEFFSDDHYMAAFGILVRKLWST